MGPRNVGEVCQDGHAESRGEDGKGTREEEEVGRGALLRQSEDPTPQDGW